jgi:hypothetical protein
LSQNETPRVALLLPTYQLAPEHYGAGRIAEARGTGKGVCEIVNVVQACGSILPHTFNQLLAHALDWRDQGHITHVAMLHDDIIPKCNRWVDVLYDEMRTAKVEMISAVVPIKEAGRARTSTAIGKIGEPWFPARFIHCDEQAATGRTFTAEHVCREGEELLVNTGMWLADLRAWWWDAFPGFEMLARITKRDGQRIAQARPEDWELSRHMRAHGARYAATWAVPLEHRGPHHWTNS